MNVVAYPVITCVYIFEVWLLDKGSSASRRVKKKKKKMKGLIHFRQRGIRNRLKLRESNRNLTTAQLLLMTSACSVVYP